MESRKSIRNLSETIHSLLGLKAHLTSAWVKSVCSIVTKISSEEASSPSALKENSFQTKDSCCNKDDESVSTEVLKISDELSALTAYVNELNIQRRQVLNDFLDLKGNIRVFCRIRPIRIGEHFGRLRPVVASDSMNVILRVAENKSKTYNFDKVFHPNSSQDEVFSEIEPVIKSVLDGYNACIFAYGQTGTGKTFTMEGTPDSPGIVPHTIKALFKRTGESNHAFLISFSMLEIYLGNPRDLLVPQPTKPTDPMPPCLSIHTDPKGGVEVENLIAIKVSDFHQALKLYRLGCRHRSTASTNSNTTSSRSHCMIRISITCFNAPERCWETNKIWLVDLGGSERVLKTQASGRRLDEGKAINLSLSALGDVINALQRKKHHIPYRNSKLTQILKDSLGQDSKTLMLVHVSPKEEDLCETICSLNFATRAKSIHLGHDQSNEERERKDAAITNLQQTMENIEEEQQRVVRDIKRLNEKLENLTGRAPASEDHMEASYISADGITYNQKNTKNKIGDVKSASSSGLPSFMRPTFSSNRKSGTGNETSDLVFARRRRPLSHRAESVTFPVKKIAEYNSDRSISNTTCAVGLTTKSNADNLTEYSQDISECDIKVVVTEDKGKPHMGSNQQRAYNFSHLEIYGDGKTFKGNSTKLSRVDNWISLQKNEPNHGTHTHKKKQITATTIPEKRHNFKEWNTNKTLRDVKVWANKLVPQKIVSPRHKDEQVNVQEIEESRTEEVINKPIMMLKDLFAVETKSDSSCPSELDEQSMRQTHNSEDDGSLMDESECCSLYPPSAGCDRFSQCTDDNEEYMLSVIEETKAQKHFSDRSVEDESMCQVSLQDVEYIADPERESSASISILERVSHYEQMLTETGMQDEQHENENTSPQLSPKERTPEMLRPKSQRALFMDNACGEGLPLPLAKLQGKLDDKGKIYKLTQKVKILCFSALLGLGFLELGYDHDFFCGITN